MKQFASVAALVVGLLCVIAGEARGEAEEGLGSSSPQIRDKTAEALRVNFVPTPRTKWEPTLSTIQQLRARDSVISLLEGLGTTPEMSISGGQTSNESFRLDNEWVLTCTFARTDAGHILRAASLRESMQVVWVKPPAGFTGTWRTYFVNGRPSQEIEYVAGEFSGIFTAYRPSGGIMYRGQYENGVRVETWVYYNEDGSVRSTENPIDSEP